MRKIEAKMIDAILARKSMQNGNTSVSINSSAHDGKPEFAAIRLHGHLIATVRYSRLEGGPVAEAVDVCLCGWNTNTTRSRLSAIIREFCALGPQGLGVSTKQGTPYIHDARGRTEIDSTGWHAVRVEAVQS